MKTRPSRPYESQSKSNVPVNFTPGARIGGWRLATAVVAIGAVGAFAIGIGAKWFGGGAEKGASGIARKFDGPRPNVLLISIDMLRTDHVHSYGYVRETTPNLDRLAAEGVLFENQISATSWTLPAHASIFTGLPTSVHGCINDDRPLNSAIPTLAQKFKEAGYATAGFFSGPYLHPAFGLGRGFDHYQDCTSYSEKMESRPADKWFQEKVIINDSHRDITSPKVLAAVRDWFKQRDGKPFFMFVHWWDAHYDFIPPPPYDKMFDPDYHGDLTGDDFFYSKRIRPGMDKRDLEHLLALYDGEIAWTDWHIGQLFDDLRAANLLDQTIVVVTSDHGTEFFEHGLKGHRITLYDEAVHVPLIMRYPATFPKGGRRAAQTRAVNIGPTLLDLAGLPPFELAYGQSLASLARTGAGPSDGATAFFDLYSVGRKMRGIRTNEWKLIQDLNAHKIQYFDLKRDPGELDSQANEGKPGFAAAGAQFQQTISSMRQLASQADRLKALAASKVGQGGNASRVPDAVQRQLRGLGYLDDDRSEQEAAQTQPASSPVSAPATEPENP